MNTTIFTLVVNDDGDSIKVLIDDRLYASRYVGCQEMRRLKEFSRGSYQELVTDVINEALLDHAKGCYFL